MKEEFKVNGQQVTLKRIFDTYVDEITMSLEEWTNTEVSRRGTPKEFMYVVGLAINKDDNSIILIEKDHPEWQKGKLNGIGGLIKESDTTVKHAMTREFLEECDIYTQEDDWQHFASLEGQDYRVYFFMSFNVNFKQARTTTSEQIWIIYLNEHQLRDDFISNIPCLIETALCPSIKFPIYLKDKNYE